MVTISQPDLVQTRERFWWITKFGGELEKGVGELDKCGGELEMFKFRGVRTR